MYLALLLSGVYLGGVIVMWVDAWMRYVPLLGDKDDGISSQSLMGCFGWPIGLVVLAALGRDRAREALGMGTTVRVRDDLRMTEDKIRRIESSLDEVRDDVDANMEEMMLQYRQAIVADVLLEVVVYEDELRRTGGAPDLGEVHRRILDTAFPDHR